MDELACHLTCSTAGVSWEGQASPEGAPPVPRAKTSELPIARKI
jgi:hypothetical protein